MKCLCGSEKKLYHCCMPLLENKKIATSAEQLMRSRYTAFATKTYHYLRETTAPEKVNLEDFLQNEAWADQVEFLNLEIVNSNETELQGTVEFKVYYNDIRTVYCSHEISRFKNIDNIWYYYDSQAVTKK